MLLEVSCGKAAELNIVFNLLDWLLAVSTM